MLKCHSDSSEDTIVFSPIIKVCVCYSYAYLKLANGTVCTELLSSIDKLLSTEIFTKTNVSQEL